MAVEDLQARYQSYEDGLLVELALLPGDLILGSQPYLIIGCWPCVRRAGFGEFFHRRAWPPRREFVSYIHAVALLLVHFAAHEDVVDALVRQDFNTVLHALVEVQWRNLPLR